MYGILGGFRGFRGCVGMLLFGDILVFLGLAVGLCCVIGGIWVFLGVLWYFGGFSYVIAGFRDFQGFGFVLGVFVWGLGFTFFGVLRFGCFVGLGLGAVDFGVGL